jgi:competence protein ComEC
MKKIIFGLAVVIFIGVLFVCSLTFNKFKISFLNVGQGDSIFVRTPDDYTILVDGGPSGAVLEELAKVMPIYNRTIDVLILSHPHADHVNGLVEIVKRYNIKSVFIVGAEYGNAYYEKFLEVLKENKVDVNFANSKRDIKVGGDVYIDVVWPVKTMVGEKFENINNASLAVKIIYSDKIIFLGGDAEKEEEGQILESGFDINANLLKAGHHGSKTASSQEFLNAVNPQTVVIQSGKDNSFGHPHKQTLEKLFNMGIEVRRNDSEGRIDFIY